MCKGSCQVLKWRLLVMHAPQSYKPAINLYYTKQKYGDNARLCYMGTYSFMLFIKAEGVYIDIAVDVDTRFVT